MENIVIEGIISTTSNKQSKEFRVENPQKTAYLELDEVNAKKLEDFGVSKYTSKDGDDFFCLKVVFVTSFVIIFLAIFFYFFRFTFFCLFLPYKTYITPFWNNSQHLY